MPDTFPSHLFAACCPTPFSPEPLIPLPSFLMCYMLSNQPYKHVGWTWQKGFLRRGWHHITNHLIYKSYMQMCRMCRVGVGFLAFFGNFAKITHTATSIS